MIEIKGITDRLKAAVKKFTYTGNFMAETFLNISVESPEPIDWTIGDFAEYRGERFELNYIPAATKVARRNTYGAAFQYTVKLNALTDELVRCDFLDYVFADNLYHFSGNNDVAFYGDVYDLAERIQVNLDRIYTGDKKWTITVDGSVESVQKQISISRQNCWNVLTLVNTEYDVNFVSHNRQITIGAAGVVVGKTFGYGKGKGLSDIKQIADEDALLVTRLRVLGSTKNMPYRYYNKLVNEQDKPYIPAAMNVPNLMLPEFPYNGGIDTFIDSDKISRYGIREYTVRFDGSDSDLPEIYPTMEGMTAEILSAAGIHVNLQPGDNGHLDEIVRANNPSDDGILPEDKEDELQGDFTVWIKDVGFDLNDVVKKGETATISMKTGRCAGREFQILQCAKDGDYNYKLICKRFVDDSVSMAYPNSFYTINSGDKFVFLNIDMPTVYIKAASQRLLSAALVFLSDNGEARFQYSPSIDENFMANNPEIGLKLKEGDLFDFSDTDLEIFGKIIVQTLSIEEDGSFTPKYKITLAEKKIASTIDKLQNSINSIISGSGNSSFPLDKIKEIIESWGNKTFLSKIHNDEGAGFYTWSAGWATKAPIYSSPHNLGWVDNPKGWYLSETGSMWLQNINVRGDIVTSAYMGSPTFASGFTGYGCRISIPTATGEMDNLFIRKTFTAYEIVYSQIYGLGGSQIVSDLNKILKVEELDDRYRCFMDDMDGLMLMNLRMGDGLRIQKRTGTTSIKYLFGRCIEISSDYFDIAKPLISGSGKPEVGDFAMRWGNDRDKNRQGLIYLTTADSGAPFIDVYDGITEESTEGKLKARLGNLSGIRTMNGDLLKGYGAYLSGVYIENSTYITDTGETIDQRFVAMNGKFNSTINGIINDMSTQSGNILLNSSFNQNTHYWESANKVHFINVNGQYLWIDGSFYVDKENVADIFNDDGRSVLRLRNTYILQKNATMNILSRVEETEDKTYSFAFYAKVVRSGLLNAGFSGTELYLEEQLTASEDYQKISLVGKWNEQGDFRISFTGEIYIYGVSLFNDALADAQIKLQTQIDQTNEHIKLYAKKEYVDKETGDIKVHYDSELKITAEQISGISTKIDNVNNTIETSKWITTAQGNELYANKITVEDLTGRVSTAESSISQNSTSITQKVSSTDYNGITIVSKVNQTSSSYKIQAKNIQLDGAVSFSMLSDYSSINSRINGKADTSSLKSLAYQDYVYARDLGTDIANTIAGKMSPDQVKNYALANGRGISPEDLAADLTKVISDKLTGTTSTSGGKLSQVIINGNTLIAGGYVQTNLINVDELWCTSLSAVRGTIGGFNISNEGITANMNNSIGKGTFAINKNGGIYFNVDSNNYARFGPVTIDPFSGVKSMCTISQMGDPLMADESCLWLMCGASIYTSAPRTWIKCTHKTGWGTQFIVQSAYFNDVNGMERTLINVGKLTSEAHIKALANNKQNFRNVGYDDTTGYLFFFI